jgi:FkbM family methyltransferase
MKLKSVHKYIFGLTCLIVAAVGIMVVMKGSGIMENFDTIKIVDENDKPVDITKYEVDEQAMADKYMAADDVVLELGARYGSVSVVVNRKLTDKKKHVVVDPDETIWAALEKNKAANGAEFQIVKGFVSNKKWGLTLGGYSTHTKHDSNSQIPSYTLAEIKQQSNIPSFTALIADCEGFLETFFDENPTILDELQKFIFEADSPERCNYEKIKTQLREKGFKEIDSGFQNYWAK